MITAWRFAMVAMSALLVGTSAWAGFFDSFASGGTRKAKVTVVRAPEAAQIMQFKSIAVSNTGGGGSSGASNAILGEIESILVNAKLRDQALFNYAGRGANADGVIGIEVVGGGVRDSRYQEPRTECLRRKRAGKSDNFLEKLLTEAQCEEGYSRTKQVDCTLRRAEITVNLKISKKGGAVVFSDAITRRAEDKACVDASKPLADGAQLLAQAQGEVAQRIRALLSPTTATLEIELMSPDISDDSDRKRFEGALRFAEESRMDRACETLRELHDRHGRNSIALNYDLGICAEAENDFWRAEEYFKAADRLTNEPHKLLSEALSRTQGNIKQAVAQGRQAPTPAPPPRTTNPSPAKLTVSPMAAPPIAGGIISADNLLEDKRVALVIGNHKYRNVAQLPNAANDAEDIAAQLRKLKFDVILRSNASWDAMNSGITEFTRRIKPGGVSLFYYAGHGAQVKDQNYLLPIDLDLKTVTANLDKDEKERMLKRQTISLNDLMDRLGETKAAFNIVILDACRDDPIEQRSRSLRRTRSASDGGSGGLASMNSPQGSFIAFSTSPGKTAADGDDKSRNSPFAEGLVNALKMPNLRIEDVMKRTREHVMKATNSEQVPWENSSLVGDFFFSSSLALAPPAAPIAPQPAAASERTGGKASRTTKPEPSAPVPAATAPAPEPAPPAQPLAPQPPVASPPRGEKGPKEFCADRPNFISRNLCESRQCKQPEWQNHPDCEQFRDKNLNL